MKIMITRELARYRQNDIQPDWFVFTTCGHGLHGSGDLHRDC